MKFISFAALNCEYTIISVLYIIIFIYDNIFVQYSDKYDKSDLLALTLFYIGNILCFFPTLILKDIPNTKTKDIIENNKLIDSIYNAPYEKNLTIKEIIMFIIVSLILLLDDFLYIFKYAIDLHYYYDSDIINNDYFFIKFAFWFLFSKYFLKSTYYKQQTISIIGILILGTIHIIFNFFVSEFFWKVELVKFFIDLFSIVTYSIYYGYMKGLMEYKFVSPYKCCYLTGLINLPIVLIIYFIVSYTPCNLDVFCIDEFGKHEHFDDIFNLFNDVNIIEVILLSLYSISSGISSLLINKTMNSFTFYHIILPFRITNFLYQMIEQLYQDELLFIKEFFSLLFFIFELLFYLIFLEIIELNFFGLNINFRKNNEKGAISDMKNGDDKNTYLAEGNDDEGNKIDV